MVSVHFSRITKTTKPIQIKFSFKDTSRSNMSLLPLSILYRFEMFLIRHFQKVLEINCIFNIYYHGNSSSNSYQCCLYIFIISYPFFLDQSWSGWLVHYKLGLVVVTYLICLTGLTILGWLYFYFEINKTWIIQFS